MNQQQKSNKMASLRKRMSSRVSELLSKITGEKNKQDPLALEEEKRCYERRFSDDNSGDLQFTPHERDIKRAFQELPFFNTKFPDVYSTVSQGNMHHFKKAHLHLDKEEEDFDKMAESMPFYHANFPLVYRTDWKGVHAH